MYISINVSRKYSFVSVTTGEIFTDAIEITKESKMKKIVRFGIFSVLGRQ